MTCQWSTAKTWLGEDVNKHSPDSTLLHPPLQIAWSLLTIKDLASLGGTKEAHLCPMLKAGNASSLGEQLPLGLGRPPTHIYDCLEGTETMVKGSIPLTKALSCCGHSLGYFPPRNNFLTQTFTGCLHPPSEAMKLSSQIWLQINFNWPHHF